MGWRFFIFIFPAQRVARSPTLAVSGAAHFGEIDALLYDQTVTCVIEVWPGFTGRQVGEMGALS